MVGTLLKKKLHDNLDLCIMIDWGVSGGPVVVFIICNRRLWYANFVSDSDAYVDIIMLNTFLKIVMFMKRVFIKM